MKRPVQTERVCAVIRHALIPIALSVTVDVAFALPGADRLLTNAGTPLTTGYNITGLKSDVLISGTVTDDKGEGLPGVNVVIKGSSKGSTTDAQGQFSINVPGPNTVLVASFVGYKSQEITVGSQTRLTIKLLADEQSLDEVVVVGYGTQSRGTVTGSVAAVKSEDILRTPAVATSSALV
ncbi:MAG TPA: carboxypeptidase-like regulatory domain-containing protein, partial [Fibrella sp.]